jgi:hypothetical protein
MTGVSDLAPKELDAFVAAFRKAAAKERGQTGEPEGGRATDSIWSR